MPFHRRVAYLMVAWAAGSLAGGVGLVLGALAVRLAAPDASSTIRVLILVVVAVATSFAAGLGFGFVMDRRFR